MSKRRINPKVSDHAIVRFLERVHGVDMMSVKAQMLSAEVLSAMAVSRRNGNRDRHVRHGGCDFVVRGDTLVTCLGPDQARGQRRRVRSESVE